MHARMTTLTLDPSRIDDAVGRLESDEVPMWRQIDGFKGFTLLVDRQSGKVVATSYWQSEEAMSASEDEVAPSRERAAETGGATEPPTVERYEVALDTMA
jgi:heme-degrading monooxygenase HmoA